MKANEEYDLINFEKTISLEILNEKQGEVKNCINIKIIFFEIETNFEIRAYRGIKLEEIRKTIQNYSTCNGNENEKIILFDKYGKDLRSESPLIMPQITLLCFSLASESKSKYSPVFVRISFENKIKHLVLGLKYDESIDKTKYIISKELNTEINEIEICSEKEKLDGSKLLSNYFLKNSGYIVCYKKASISSSYQSDSYYIVDLKGEIFQFDTSKKLDQIITDMYQGFAEVYKLKENKKIENLSIFEALENDLLFILPGQAENTCVTINLKFQSGNLIPIKIASDYTIEDVKKIIEFTLTIPYYIQGLIFNAKELEDNRKISDYQIQDKSILNVIYKLK